MHGIIDDSNPPQADRTGTKFTAIKMNGCWGFNNSSHYFQKDSNYRNTHNKPRKDSYTCTLFSKRKVNLICQFSLVPQAHWPWHRYIPQKKCNFQKLTFLLEKRVRVSSYEPTGQNAQVGSTSNFLPKNTKHSAFISTCIQGTRCWVLVGVYNIKARNDTLSLLLSWQP